MSKAVLRSDVSLFILSREELIDLLLEEHNHDFLFSFLKEKLEEMSDADLLDLLQECASENGWDFESLADIVEEEYEEPKFDVVLEEYTPKKTVTKKKKK
jgi:hypothetical protein